MDIQHFLQELVKKSSGGIPYVAEKMDIPYATLKNKLNPNIYSNHLYIQEYQQIDRILKTDQIAKYHASESGGVFVKSHKLDYVPDTELLDLFLEREERYGKFANKVRKALEDGNIKDDEYSELMRLFDDVSETREQIKARLTRLNEQWHEREERLAVRAVR